MKSLSKYSLINNNFVNLYYANIKYKNKEQFYWIGSPFFDP